VFARIQNAVRASVVASIATGYRPNSHRARRDEVRRLMAKEFHHLSPREIDDASAILFAVTGSRVWYVLTAELGMDADRGGAAANWVLGLMLADLRKRDRAAARRSKTRRRPHDA
jgi:hypothetical protein